MRTLAAAALVLMMLVGSTDAHASFIGKQIEAAHAYPDLATPWYGPYVATVGGAIEFPAFGNGGEYSG